MADGAIRRCRPLLGTFVEIAAPAGREDAVAAAYAAMAHVHARMSFHEETSDLAALRRAAAGTVVTVDRETVAVLRVAADLHDRSRGLFDVSIAAELVRSGFLPCPPPVDPGRMTGTAGDIDILDDTHVRCRRPMLIDLGGIAKGHAVDRAAGTLMEAGVEQAIVNAGGDLRVIGDAAEPIHLRRADGTIDHAVSLANAALASSANLLDRRRHAGRDVTPHIGRDRRPVLADHAVTIVAERCIIADAMTKIALADPHLAATMLDELGGEILSLPALRAA